MPPGSGVLTWTYDPPGWAAGWMVSACALTILLALLALLLWQLATRRGLWTRCPASASLGRQSTMNTTSYPESAVSAIACLGGSEHKTAGRADGPVRFTSER